jgi:hypothetical protein
MQDSSRNPNPPSLRRILGEHITGRCSGTGIRGAHFMRLRPPAELRRYISAATDKNRGLAHLLD